VDGADEDAVLESAFAGADAVVAVGLMAAFVSPSKSKSFSASKYHRQRLYRSVEWIKLGKRSFPEHQRIASPVCQMQKCVPFKMSSKFEDMAEWSEVDGMGHWAVRVSSPGPHFSTLSWHRAQMRSFM